MGQGVAGLAAGSLHAEARQLLNEIAGLLPSMAAALTVILITWGLATLARRIAQYCFRYVNNPTRRNLIRHVTYYVAWALGIFAALDVLGVNPTTFVTGLGLGGVALGFALKDLVSNLVSGLMILLTGTFQINDQIVVGDTEGTVERIEVRATHIRRMTAGWSWSRTGTC